MGPHTRVEVQDPRSIPRRDLVSKSSPDVARSQLSIQFDALATATPILVTENSPFGSGFIGWGLVPGLHISGELSVCGQSFPMSPHWYCYHDRNFGRFRWGEDIGWEWFVAYVICDDGTPMTLVLDQRTNKDHTERGFPYIFIYIGSELTKVFVGATLQIHWDWSDSSTIPPRLPGIMALLFSDRQLHTPTKLQVTAADEKDQLMINLNFESIVELIVPDNQQRQYTFIEEVTGSAAVILKLGEQIFPAQGLVYAEYSLS
jgi:hypothetical protein